MISYQAIVARLEDCRQILARHEGQKTTLESLLADYEKQVGEFQRLDLAYGRLQKFFQSMGAQEQERLQRWFEQVITYGLQAVFGLGYRFIIIGPEIKMNEIAIGFTVIERSGDQEYERDPYTEMGGGIADVLAFLLQFVMVFLLRDRINPILFLDEAMKHLSEEYRPKIATLMQELVERTGVQIVLVTHDPTLAEAADTVYRFEHNGKETVVEKVK